MTGRFEHHKLQFHDLPGRLPKRSHLTSIPSDTKSFCCEDIKCSVTKNNGLGVRRSCL